MNVSIMENIEARSILLRAAEQINSDSARNALTSEIIGIENELAKASPATDRERRALLGLAVETMITDGADPAHIGLVQAALR